MLILWAQSNMHWVTLHPRTPPLSTNRTIIYSNTFSTSTKLPKYSPPSINFKSEELLYSFLDTTWGSSFWQVVILHNLQWHLWEWLSVWWVLFINPLDITICHAMLCNYGNLFHKQVYMYNLHLLRVYSRFTSVKEFEYTPECIVFDLLSIGLYHGWLYFNWNSRRIKS